MIVLARVLLAVVAAWLAVVALGAVAGFALGSVELGLLAVGTVLALAVWQWRARSRG